MRTQVSPPGEAFLGLALRGPMTDYEPGSLYTTRAEVCTLHRSGNVGKAINVTLDDEHATKLAKLAERTHVQEGTLARSLLSTALDDVDPDASRITEVLDASPGAWERTRKGLAEADRGEGAPLDELA
jgi:predicted transcriptional regulator